MQEKYLNPIIYVLSVVATNLVLFFGKVIEYSRVPKTILILLSFALILDSILGVLAARKLKRSGKNVVISSKIGIRGLLFKVVMLVVLVLLGIALSFVGFEHTWFLSSILSLLLAFECFSVLGNIQVIRTGQEKDEYDAITLLIRALQIRLKKIFINGLNLLAGENVFDKEINGDKDKEEEKE